MHNPTPNDITLQTYTDQSQKYIDSTPAIINDAEYPWIDQSLDHIPARGSVLEIGAGAGRNAEHIAKRGFALACTEPVREFVDIMQQQGIDARHLNILTDDIEGTFDMIIANGVLVHFNPTQTVTVFNKVHKALNTQGIFAFSIKIGEGEKWTNEKLDAPRYFYFWQPDQMRSLAEAHGFEWISATSGDTSLKNASWLYIIVRKK